MTFKEIGDSGSADTYGFQEVGGAIAAKPERTYLPATATVTRAS